VSRLVYRPVVMLLLGALITLVSMSVSVSISILVPLSNRGFVRRENIIPYIMGANITTFIDTLLAAVLLQNPRAFTVVLVEMTSVAVVSAVILLFFFGIYERAILALVDKLVHNNLNLALFIAVIFAIPLLLVLL
jgi:sodium-dependent phosphate cotransporter